MPAKSIPLDLQVVVIVYLEAYHLCIHHQSSSPVRPGQKIVQDEGHTIPAKSISLDLQAVVIAYLEAHHSSIRHRPSPPVGIDLYIPPCSISSSSFTVVLSRPLQTTSVMPSVMTCTMVSSYRVLKLSSPVPRRSIWSCACGITRIIHSRVTYAFLERSSSPSQAASSNHELPVRGETTLFLDLPPSTFFSRSSLFLVLSDFL
jgi:hypothetical protein